MIIYCDMDGVLVNFVRGVEQLLGHMPVDQKDYDQILKLKDKFWSNLSPMPEMHRLWKLLHKYDAHILSAEASWDRNAGVHYSRIGKMMWIKRHLGIPLKRVHIVKRVEKQNFAQSESGPNLLIDDKKQNVLEFKRAGGKAIYHTSVSPTLNELRKLGYQ